MLINGNDRSRPIHATKVGGQNIEGPRLAISFYIIKVFSQTANFASILLVSW